MAVLQYKDPVTGQLKDLPLINQGVKEAPIDGKQYARKDGEWSEIEVDSNVDLSDYTTKEELNNALLGKVDKQEGKQLTTEDFTTVLKEKLDSLSNYNDTEIRNAIDSLESAFNTLVEGNATAAIDTFNEIIAFLKNVENSQDLDSIIAGINTTISNVESKIPDTNNFLSKDGGIMNNTDLVGNLNADMLDGLHSNEFLIKGPRVYSKEDFDTKYRFASMYSTDYMSPVDGAYNYGQVLSFVDNCSTTQFYCPDNTGLIYFRNKWGTDTKGSENFANIPWYEIITSKNIGSQAVASSKKFVPRYITNLNTDGINEFFSSGFQPSNGHSSGNYATGFTVGNSELGYTYQFAFDTYGKVYTRYKNTTEWKTWKEIAFTDGSVATANKLSTTRYLWGQSFDGSGDVYGDLKSMDGYNFASTTSNYVLFGYGYAQNNKTVYLDGSPIYFRYGTNHNIGMILNSNGNVTIGEGDSASSNWKLYVNGNVFHNGVVSTNNFIRLYGKTNVSSDVYLDNTTYSGLHIRSNSSSYMLIGSNVGINTTTPQESLDVNGNIRVTGYARLTGNVFINSGTSSDNNRNAGKLFFGGSNSENHGVYLSATKYDTYGRKRFGIFTTSAASETPNWIESFSITPGGSVGINTTTPQEALDVNGNIKLNGEIRFKEGDRLDQYGNLRFGEVSDNWGIFNYSGSKLFTVMHSNGYVGIGIADPEYKLDINGNVGVRGPMSVKGTIFMSLNTSLFMADENTGIYLSDYGIHWHNSDNTWHSSIMTCDGSVIYLYKPLRIKSDVHLTDSDQINGTRAGISLNYECGKAVNTTIWDGKGHHIMRVFGEDRQVAIGPAAVESPRGILNVDGEVIFESSRFTTTSGFVDGDYAYSHAIYGGYHGIDVCEFYENEFKFKTNGGDITSFTLNRYYADFNGSVRTYNCDFTGVHWNGNTRFRLTRDGESSTWLQAGTDTTAENGDLYMSGLYGNLLRQFNVWTSVSNFKGSIIAEGDVTAYSDIRLKNRIESVNNVLDTIDTLDVFRYTWKDREDKSIHIGVSAQQVQTIYPEFVLTSSSEDGTDYLTVNYAALATCIAIQGIKELAKKGDERDKRIAALEEEVISLKEQLRYGNK